MQRVPRRVKRLQHHVVQIKNVTFRKGNQQWKCLHLSPINQTLLCTQSLLRTLSLLCTNLFYVRSQDNSPLVDMQKTKGHPCQVNPPAGALEQGTEQQTWTLTLDWGCW